MDSNKFLIVVAAVLAAFLGLPIVMQQVKANREGAAATAPAPGQAATPAGAPAAETMQREPPRLNASNIIGTEWALQADQYKLKCAIMPNGVLYVYHPMLKSMMGVDYIQGNWQLDYDKVTVTAQFGGQSFNEVVYISGDKLVSKDGRPVERFK